ncbi:MAG: valine--tRNA ligase [Candidatus Wildermuthbacteria bacterium]|nr:valine--tRNA ligase [Candidatus Wildermuthbacteria bacterium]
MDLPKTYDHTKVENKIYALQEKSGFFNPDRLPNKGKPFTILMPPPNANDPLHVGHALFVALQDIMVRYQRMKGRKALWLPGEDHAGFETQVVFEKKLEKQGRSRFDMTREQFFQEVFDYTQENRKTVREQLKKLGASCDWSRDTFTLDKHVVKTVYQTFKKMADEKLIYRGERLVNYCTRHRTAFSNLEIAHETRKDPLYYIKYGPITLATVRPETKFGDTAIAVHPEDKRYQQYIGKEIVIDTLLGEKKMKVIADTAVDPVFGTGAVKVTPAHDQNDYEIWMRHKQEIPGPLKVIAQDGKLTDRAGPYAGLRVKEAREKIAADMSAKGLIEKVDEQYEHTVSLCYKCRTVLEPTLMSQWFMRMKPLAKPALEAVREKKVVIIPANYAKVYSHWMNHIEDWNISRQNWWGIAIPAWKCGACSKPEAEKWIITDGKTPKTCPTCKSSNLVRDPDVFDTWFSSGQWPFAVLGYPTGKDFKTFYPTSVMETSYDILFFWVARMIMLGLYRTGKIPFETVYLHGLIRDKDRQKMSKSKGNVIDPLGVIEQYGTDALRIALVAGNTPGSDSAISEEKIRGYRNFINKVWNISRFVLLQSEDYSAAKKPRLAREDTRILKDFEAKAKKITEHIEKFRFFLATEVLYHYIWHTFADKVLEQSKEVLQNPKTRASRQYVLLEVLLGILKLLHPFAPFVTEEIYQQLPLKNKKKTIMIEPWPT